MDFHPEKVFFKADTVDPYTNLPVYVFDSTYLPTPSLNSISPDQDISFESLLLKAFKKLIPRIPTNPYVLICFTCGFKSLNNQLGSQSWITLLKCYQLLPKTLKPHLKKVYIVHESWVIRSFLQVLSKINIRGGGPFKSSQGETKYDRLNYVKDLNELARLVDITKIRISLNVYLYDNMEKLIVPYQVKHTTHEYQQYRSLINQRVLQRLSMEAAEHELVIARPGNQARMGILVKAIERGNYLDLSQWDIYVIGSLLHHFLRGKPIPLIPIEKITLPMEDTFEYTLRIYQSFTESTEDPQLKDIMPVLVKLLENSDTSRHTLRLLSKAMTPSLCHVKSSLQNSDEFIVGQRYIRNLIEYWCDIEGCLNTGEVSVVKKKSTIPPTIPKARKVSQPTAAAVNNKEISTTKIEKRSEPKSLPTPPSSTSSLLLKQPPSIPSLNSRHSRSLSSSNSSLHSSRTTSTNSLCSKSPERSTPTPSSSSEPTEPLKFNPASFPSTLKPQPLPSALSSNPPKPKTLSEDLKFSDKDYSNIQGEKKVSQLAKLYEERLRGLEVMKELQLDD